MPIFWNSLDQIFYYTPRWYMDKFWDYRARSLTSLDPPETHPYNPFEKRSDGPKDDLPLPEESLAKRRPNVNRVVKSVSAGKKTKKGKRIKDVRASDYVTPQKYLDGSSEIPTWYTFQSNMIPSEDQAHGMACATEVDRRLTLPTRTHIRFLITATDVLHSFSCAGLGIKLAALPGRVSRLNTFILREGVFYGQCAEMCGPLHSFMPIVIEAVSPEAYAAHAKKYYKD